MRVILGHNLCSQGLAGLYALQPPTCPQPQHHQLLRLSKRQQIITNNPSEILGRPVNPVKKRLKSRPCPHWSASATTFACSGCLICIRRVFFASSKARRFLQNMSAGAGPRLRRRRRRRAEVRRAASKARTNVTGQRRRASPASTRTPLHHGFHS